MKGVINIPLSLTFHELVAAAEKVAEGMGDGDFFAIGPISWGHDTVSVAWMVEGSPEHIPVGWRIMRKSSRGLA